MKKLYRAAPIVLLMLGGSAFAQSTSIPQELLDLNRVQCTQGCAANASAEACKALCGCTVTEFQKRMDIDRYLDLSAQLSRNELTPENRTLLDTIANYCVAELDKAGIQVGVPQDTDAKNDDAAEPK